MVKFIAKALVTFNAKDGDWSQKTEIESELKKLGYHPGIWYNPNLHNHLTIENGCYSHINLDLKDRIVTEDNFIDCNAYSPHGTEEEAIKLFIELAQMRDDTDSAKWYCIDFLYPQPVYAKIRLVNIPNGYKVLTPIELAEAYKEREIVL